MVNKLVLEWAEKKQAGMGNATLLKIGQGHFQAMPNYQTSGTGINVADIGHLQNRHLKELFPALHTLVYLLLKILFTN